MIFFYKDLLFNIKSFLNNEDIIELLTTSKNINKNLGKNNIFTSLKVKQDSNICDLIRVYLKHKLSLTTVFIINIKDPVYIWPFDCKKMIFVNCNINDEYVTKNYKTSHTIINNKYFR